MQKSVEGFRQYLESLNILPDNQLPYFLWWLKHCNQLGVLKRPDTLLICKNRDIHTYSKYET